MSPDSSSGPGLALTLALAARASGDPVGAAQWTRSLQDEYPGVWQAWWAAGLLALEREATDEALESFARAARLADDRPAVLVNLGIVQWLEGHPADARRTFARAASLDGFHVRAVACLGMAHLVAGLEVEAERTLARAASTGGDAGVGSLGLGVLCSRRGQWHEAERCFLSIPESAGARRAALVNVAQVWRGRGMLEEAARCTREAVRLGFWPEVAYETWRLALAPIDALDEDTL
ncbi:MAG: tetratricopeptide repeat protein [Candidatus Sericytochromatia bacterium]|nr:tetratricopeptide repeat protein [Candidatus Sericytochromatia bacterium]